MTMYAGQKRNMWTKASIFIFAMVLISCDLTSSPRNTGNFFPLSEGNRWKMVDSIRQNGVFRAQDTFDIYVGKAITIAVGGQSLQAFKVNWGTMDPDSLFSIERMESDGLSVYGASEAGKDTVIGKSLDIKYPAAMGDKWYRKSVYWSGAKWVSVLDTLEFVSLDTAIVTPAGNFHCFGVKWGSGVNFGFDYYSIGVGLVAATFISNGTLFTKSLLLSYSLK